MVEGAPHEYKESPGACAACGNSPVNHFEQYMSNTLAVWSAERAYRAGGSTRVSQFADWLFGYIEQPFFRILALLPFVRFSTDVSAATTYRSQVVWEEAQRRGIEMEHLVIFGSGTEIYRARIDGAKWHYFQSLPVPEHMRGAHTDWIDDKYLLKQALRAASIASPLSLSASSEEAALQALQRIDGAVVIKPRSGSRARHTSVALRSEDDVIAAFRSARQLCRHVSVEQYLEGSVCRGTVVGGRLVGFFEGQAPTVRGDGVSTIRELIEKANAGKPERVQDIVVTKDHEQFLSRKSLTLDSVLKAGEMTPLTHRTGRLFGGRTRELLKTVHPALRAHLERAAALLGVPVVGFDLIIKNPENDPDSQTWGIIEANSLPYIDLHYLPLTGEPSNVASAVWDLWDSPMHTIGVDGSEERVTMTA